LIRAEAADLDVVATASLRPEVTDLRTARVGLARVGLDRGAVIATPGKRHRKRSDPQRAS
jgi:hypothetical protein